MNPSTDPLLEPLAKLLYGYLNTSTAWADVCNETREEFLSQAEGALTVVDLFGRLYPADADRSYDEWATYDKLTGMHVWRDRMEAIKDSYNSGTVLMTRQCWWSHKADWQTLDEDTAKELLATVAGVS